MSTRKAIPLKTQLAAALLQLADRYGDPLIRYPDSKMMTASQIISLFELDHHPVRVADGGPSEAWNLTWRLRAEHKVKTATIDQPQMAKQRRIRAREMEHRASLQTKISDVELEPGWLMRDVARASARVKTWAKQSKTIQSRPFPAGRKFASQR